MQRIQIKKVDVTSFAKWTAFVAAVPMAIMGVFLIFAGLVTIANGGIFFIISAFLYPVFAAIVGFIGGAITASLYGLFAKSFGGVTIELGPETAGSVAQRPNVLDNFQP